MTREEALQIARTIAEKENWLWLEPVKAHAACRFFVFGKRSWHVYTNAGSIGCNIHVQIDDETGEIISKGFAPR